MRIDGYNDEEIRTLRANETSVRERAFTLQLAYAGWVVTYPPFRYSRDNFKEQGQSFFEQEWLGPDSQTEPHETAAPKLSEHELAYSNRKIGFLREWQLEELVTWELPLPMGARLIDRAHYEMDITESTGAILFVPWFLLRRNEIRLDEIALLQMQREAPPYLEAWLKGDDKNWGVDRLAMMFRLHVYYVLALKARYSNRLRGKTKQLDRAFARFLYKRSDEHDQVTAAEDSIKKIRQELLRRLSLSITD